jgi:hypothetical protein
MTPAKRKSRRRTFDNEWTFQVFEEHASFFTRRMFGGLLMMITRREWWLSPSPLGPQGTAHPSGLPDEKRE